MNAVLPPPQLFVRTVALRTHSGSLVRHLPAGAPLAWLTGDDGIVGWGQAARLDLSGEPPGTEPTDTARFTAAARWVDGAEVLDVAVVADEALVRLPVLDGRGLVRACSTVSRDGARSGGRADGGTGDGGAYQRWPCARAGCCRAGRCR